VETFSAELPATEFVCFC